MSKTVSRSLLAAALGGALIASPALIGSGQAFAEDGETGSITINAVTGNEGNVYNGYQIFTADTNAEGKGQHIAWVNDAAKTAVTGVIKAQTGADAFQAWATGKGYLAANASNAQVTEAVENPQLALEYLSDKWGESNATRIVGNSELPNKIAKAFASAAATTTVTAGTAKDGLAEGWWLFTTQNNSTSGDKNKTGTSPIFTPISKQLAKTVTEKTSLPSVTKTVTDDATGATAGNHADANTSQDLAYHLEGSIATNFSTYEKYAYKFEDTLTNLEITVPAGQKITNVVTVKIDGTAVKTSDEAINDGARVSYAGNKLTVDFQDLKACLPATGGTTPVALTASSKVTVDYNAHLTDDAVTTNAGNPNTVAVFYSNNPNQTSTGKTPEAVVKTYTHQIELTKIDKATKVPLTGAQVSLQLVAGDGSEADGNINKYVQADGSLGDNKYSFTTGTDGKFTVSGIDVGRYKLVEETAPTNYDKWPDIELVVAATYDNAGARTGMTATLTGGEGDRQPADTSQAITGGTGVYSVNNVSGKIEIKATDDKISNMPLTGQDGIVASIVGGVVLIGAGVVLGIRRSKAAKQA